MNTTVPQGPADGGRPARKKLPRVFGFWAYRQGAAVWHGLLWGLLFFFINPNPANVVEGCLWFFIGGTIIFGFHLGLTQMLPVITAPIFESHFATLKDIGVSVWFWLFPSAAVLLSLFLGIMDILWFRIDVDMTLTEWGLYFFISLSFALDVLFGTTFTTMKNRLADEAGLGKMPDS